MNTPGRVGQNSSMRSIDPRHTWSTGFARTIAEELRHGVATGAVTWSEADELLNRLRTVIDQALDVHPQPL
ncbi:hypothetical protein GCM10025792_19060 [Pseudonocardia tropica]